MPLRDVLLALLIAVMWGFNFVVMKAGVGELPPLLLATLRFALAAFPLVLLLPRPAVPRRYLWSFALLFGVTKFSLLFLALRLGMPSGITSVVLQLQAAFTIVLAAILLGERVSRPQAAGMLLAGLGLATLALARTAGVTAGPFLLVLLAALAWGLANIAAKKALTFDPLAFAVWTSFLAVGPLTALLLLVEGPAAISEALAAVTWRGIGSVLYQAYPVNLLGLAIWSGLIARHPAALVAPFALLVPVLGLIAGHLVYAEPLSAGTIAGAAFIVAGIGVIVFGGSTSRKAA